MSSLSERRKCMYPKINLLPCREDKLPTKMTNFKFSNIFQKTKTDRDRRRNKDYGPSKPELVLVQIPISKSFKVCQHVQLTPVTISPSIPTMKTAFYKDDRVWWSYCCFGCWCNSCAGLLTNLKMGKNISKVLDCGIDGIDGII